MQLIRFYRSITSSAIFAVLLTACGGGGSDAPPSHTVTAGAGANGTISPASATVTTGNTASFTVTPDTGFNIASVTGCGGTLTGNTYTTGSITATCAVNATFSIVNYNVTAVAGAGGIINPTGVSVDHGSTTSFTVTPDAGFLLDSVGGCNGSLTGNTFQTGAVTGDCIVNAAFIAVSPVIQITQPDNLSLTRLAATQVAGTVNDSLSTITVNGVPAPNVNGTFAIDGIALAEGLNTIVATAVRAAGTASTSAITVLRDSTPPTIGIESPATGTFTSAQNIAIAGNVRDASSSSVGNGELDVRCNGIPAIVSNSSFVAFAVPIQPGANEINCSVADETGNSANASVSLTQRAPAGQRIELVSGNDQTAMVGTDLAQPIAIRLVDVSDQPVPGRKVRFRISRGAGELNAGSVTGRDLELSTDTNGLASIGFRLGSRAGAGNHRVVASAAGFAGEVEVCAVAIPGPAARLIPVAGGEQRGAAGGPLPHPFEILVAGAAGNPLAGVPVLFEVLEGGGSFDGADSIAVQTNAAGRAAATLTLGSSAGINNNIVRASSTAVAGSQPLFAASGVTAGLAEMTTASGLVLDNSALPIPGATVSIDGTTFSTITDDEGSFALSGIPVGPITLRIDGSTSTRPEGFPALQFEVIAIAGRDNDVRRTIELPTLNSAGIQICGGVSQCELTMADVPGLRLTVAPQSVTFQDGSSEGPMSISQVNFDKVPMIPPSGSLLMPAWTIQPSGARFDPPAQVTIPNMQGARPGQQVDIFQFDHAMEDFVSVGTGTVSEDGSVIASDPGSGITVSGWGGPRPPPSGTTDATSAGEQLAEVTIQQLLSDAAGATRLDTIGWVGIIQSSTTFACAAHLDVVDEVHKRVREIAGKSARLCCGLGPPYSAQPCLFRGDPTPLANTCDLLEAVEREFGRCK